MDGRTDRPTKKCLIENLFATTDQFSFDQGFYRQDPNKSGGGTQSFSITPYSLYSSSKFIICFGGMYLRWIQLALPWRFSNFHQEHPQIVKIEEKIVQFFGGSQRVILRNLRMFLLEIQKSLRWRQLYPP